MKPAAGSSSSCCVVLQKMATHFVGFFFVSIDFVDVLFLHRLFIIAVFFAGFRSVCFYLTEIDSTLFFSHFLSAKQLLIGSVPNFVFFFNIFLFNGVLALSLFYFVRHFRRSRCFARGFGTWTRERERETHHVITENDGVVCSSQFFPFFSLSPTQFRVPSNFRPRSSWQNETRSSYGFFLIGSLSLEWFDVKVAKKKGTKPEEIDESTAIADWSRPLKRPINVPTLRATRQNPVTPNS